jgi:hypothetical protein
MRVWLIQLSFLIISSHCLAVVEESEIMPTSAVGLPQPAAWSTTPPPQARAQMPQANQPPANPANALPQARPDAREDYSVPPPPQAAAQGDLYPPSAGNPNLTQPDPAIPPSAPIAPGADPYMQDPYAPLGGNMADWDGNDGMVPPAPAAPPPMVNPDGFAPDGSDGYAEGQAPQGFLPQEEELAPTQGE